MNARILSCSKPHYLSQSAAQQKKFCNYQEKDREGGNGMGQGVGGGGGDWFIGLGAKKKE